MMLRTIRNKDTIIAISNEAALGLDTSSVIVENVPLIISNRPVNRIKRLK